MRSAIADLHDSAIATSLALPFLSSTCSSAFVLDSPHFTAFMSSRFDPHNSQHACPALIGLKMGLSYLLAILTLLFCTLLSWPSLPSASKLDFPLSPPLVLGSRISLTSDASPSHSLHALCYVQHSIHQTLLFPL
jgi:hypothetical protein